LLFLASLLWPPPVCAQEVGPIQPRLLVSTAEQVIVELRFPPVQIGTVETEGKKRARLTLPGVESAAAPGQPLLPHLGFLIGLPPRGRWSIRVLDVERESVALPFPPETAPAADLPPPPFGLVPPPVQTESFPTVPLAVEEPAILRDLRVLPLHLYPLYYDADRGMWEQIRRVTIRVQFRGEVGRRRPSSPPDDWDPLLAQVVLNYDQARAWRGVHPIPKNLTLNPAATGGSFKAEVEADGLYQITYAALQGAGFPLDTDPRNLHVTVDGQEIAVWLPGEGDGHWDSGDRVVFYGQAVQSRYTRRNVYWLTVEDTPGLRMAERAVTPTGGVPSSTAHWLSRRFEENHLYDSKHAGIDGDHWYWTDLAFLQTGCPLAVQTYTFDLPLLQGSSPTATLTVAVQGYTGGSHHLIARLNGHLLGDIQWSGEQGAEEIFTFNPGWFRLTNNVLRLENGDCPPPPPPSPPPNGMAFNHFSVGHWAAYEAQGGVLAFRGESGARQYRLGGLGGNPSLFDITDPTRPVRLTGGQTEADGRFTFRDDAPSPRRYLALAEDAFLSPAAVYRDTPSRLTATDNQADYLLIGYGPFLAATQPLLALRAAQGLTTMAVDVQDVYDEFGGGRLDPQAIHDFLAYALAQWQKPPDYVLLVGDGTVDYLGYLGGEWRNFIPAYVADVDPYLGETASDNRLACVAGDDNLPDLHIGRLPVGSVAETEAVVAKIVAYETSPPPALVRRRVLLTADNDSLDVFAQYSDRLYDSLPSPIRGERVYLAIPAEEAHEYDPTDPDALTAAKAALKDNLEQGQLLATFMGHSSHSQWAEEKLLHRDNVPDLRTAGRLPVVLSLTCYTGSFHYPPYAPLDERLAVEAEGGAVAAWGATGAGIATGHRYLAQGFFDTVLQEGGSTLGAATWVGKVRLYNNAPVNRDLVDTYVLLGDPATRVQPYFGPVYATYLPLVRR